MLPTGSKLEEKNGLDTVALAEQSMVKRGFCGSSFRRTEKRFRNGHTYSGERGQAPSAGHEQPGHVVGVAVRLWRRCDEVAENALHLLNCSVGSVGSVAKKLAFRPRSVRRQHSVLDSGSSCTTRRLSHGLCG